MIETDDKAEVMDRLKQYLEQNKSVDLRVFLFAHWNDRLVNTEFVNEVANMLRTTDKYEITPVGSGLLASYIIAKSSWRNRNPLWNEVRVGIITSILSLLVGWLLIRAENKQQTELDNQQNSSLNRLFDSIKILSKKIEDSIKLQSRGTGPSNP